MHSRRILDAAFATDHAGTIAVGQCLQKPRANMQLAKCHDQAKQGLHAGVLPLHRILACSRLLPVARRTCFAQVFQAEVEEPFIPSVCPSVIDPAQRTPCVDAGRRKDDSRIRYLNCWSFSTHWVSAAHFGQRVGPEACRV